MKYPTKPVLTTKDLLKYQETFERLLSLHRTKLEIAEALFTKVVILDEFANLVYGMPFENLSAGFSSRSNAELVANQFDKAYSGKKDSRMLIFLGKNYAKQTDDTILANVAAEQIVFVDDMSEVDDATTSQ